MALGSSWDIWRGGARPYRGPALGGRRAGRLPIAAGAVCWRVRLAPDDAVRLPPPRPVPDPLRDQLQHSLGAAYTLERELGGGGMSRVFLAEEVRLGRKVVVKVLPPEMSAAVNIDRFEREIQLAAKLQHPHIVPLLSAGADMVARVWDLRRGVPIVTVPFGMFAWWSPAGDEVLSILPLGDILLWEGATGRLTRRVALPGGEQALSATWLPGGGFAVGGRAG